MFPMGGLAQQRSARQMAALQHQDRFYHLWAEYNKKGWQLISVSTDRARGVERITVQRPTPIPRVQRKAVA